MTASARPSQKTRFNFSCKINQVPIATHNGAVLPSRVAFAAVVKARDEFQSEKSPAVNIPAKMGKIKTLFGIGIRVVDVG